MCAPDTTRTDACQGAQTPREFSLTIVTRPPARGIAIRAEASRRRIRKAIAAGVGFLARTQGADGLWRDFRCFVGDSDEWVTAYVCNALIGTKLLAARRSIQQASRSLKKRQRPDGGWGYNADSPPDADSTGWALRAFLALRASTLDGAPRAETFLALHQRSDGGIATYASRMPLRRKFVRPFAWRNFAGWCVTDPCVTAAVIPVLDAKRQRRALAFLRRRQGADGRWRGYWWADAEYATTLTLD